ncbi:uncharacterized protein LOC127851091 isoform X3 [Dreissena polymorpha]|uniref:Uncharacterized protein n=1 Tax=Dreissena polymorpha TaxID=45954 RepID=A0A9D4I176_DREPO|nr:uncharacterized protein LOC127851091 isoform X3 [Dreissena polymorpha]KAH3740077.1 hypothetical protein DPMN_046772 [Dreissena polymorpha]
MRTSCCQIIGLILLVNTNLALIIAFATPYWVEWRGILQALGRLVGHGHSNTGLWGSCTGTDCDWALFGRDEVWFKATQGLMSAAMALGILALIVATLSLCCTCHSCNPHQPICGFLIVASLCIAVALVVFGIKANQEWNIDFQMDISSSGRFGWSFWTAIGAAGGALLTSVIYCCMDRKSS